MSKLCKFLQRCFRRFAKAKVPPVATNLEQKLGAKIQERQQGKQRFSHYEPNMPKSQPCPQQHGWKRRTYKTVSGANYYCNTCKQGFFVKGR